MLATKPGTELFVESPLSSLIDADRGHLGSLLEGMGTDAGCYLNDNLSCLSSADNASPRESAIDTLTSDASRDLWTLPAVLNQFSPATLLTDPSIPLALALGWALLVVLSSASNGLGAKILSLRASFAELCDHRNRGTPLDTLDIFRFIAIAWVMLNHLGSEGRLDVLDRLPSGAVFKEAIHSHPIFGPLVGNSALGVEIFLVLSGLLAARSWDRRMTKLGDKGVGWNMTAFIVRRILRIMPVVWVYVYFASSPLMRIAMPKFHSTMISACTPSQLLSHLTLTNNLQETPTCLGYLWYLGLDMQLYLAAPLVLYFLTRRWRVTVMGLFGVIGVSAAIRAGYCRAYGVCNNSDVDIPFISYPDLTDPAQLRQIYAGLWDMYSRPHTTCGPFLLGLMLGRLFIRRPSDVKLPVGWRTLFAAGLALAVATVYGILPEYWHPQQGDTLYNTLYTALFRTMFAAAVCAMIAALYYSGRKFHVHPAWSVLAKLTFNVYLLHMPVVYLFNHVAAFQLASGPVELLLALPFAVAASFAAALVFYLLIESPVGRLTSQICQYVRV